MNVDDANIVVCDVSIMIDYDDDFDDDEEGHMRMGYRGVL